MHKLGRIWELRIVSKFYLFHNGLGIIWRDGLVDGKKDMKKALAHFGAAANQELAEAQVNLGKYAYCES